MRNFIKIRCPNCDRNMKSGTNERILQGNRDGIAMCLSCGFRVGFVVVYRLVPSAPEIRIPPTVSPGKTVRAPMIFCPICRSPARVRTSERISESLKLMRAYCWDEQCGHRFKAFLELTEQLSVVAGARRTGIPYRPGLIDDFRRELEHRNKLPRLIHER